MMADAVQRRRFRQYHELCRRVSASFQAGQARYVASGGRALPPHQPVYPPLPADLRALACGAKTRGGGECKRTDIHLSGRCKFHGGLSSGPKTKAGKARSLANLRQNRPALNKCGIVESIPANGPPT